MSNVRTVFRREFAAYFNSPIAYIFITVFLLLTGGLYMMGFFMAKSADMWDFFDKLPWILIFFIPAISMRLWAEDRRSGTFELLMTMPMKSHEVMWGKYLAAMAFYIVALLGTLSIPIMLVMVGHPDLGAIFSGYIGALLAGALYMGVGIFISGLMNDQISAFILSMLICFVIFLVGEPSVTMAIDGWIEGFGTFLAKGLGLSPHFNSMRQGVVKLPDLVYFLGLTGAFLSLNGLWLEGRRH